MKTISLLLLSVLLLDGGSPGALEASVTFDLASRASSNVYLDRSGEWDLVLKPELEASLDFATYWSTGYHGELSAFTRHRELFSHWHELYLFMNPAWGASGENEATVELSLQTLRNRSTYASLNLVQPGLLANVFLEPLSWLRWHLEARSAYRWFYDDRESSSVDVWSEAGVAFTLPSHTTIAPRLAFGWRYFTGPGSSGSTSDDRQDLQLVAGLAVSQELARRLGLQLRYAYLQAIGDSGILQNKLTREQFSYLGEEFLFSGHRGEVVGKWLPLPALGVWVGVRLERRAYAGWPALDENGLLTGDNRADTRLGPRLALEYRLQRSSGRWPALKLAIDYQFLRQWSNHYWYDTSVHLGGISFWGTW